MGRFYVQSNETEEQAYARGKEHAAGASVLHSELDALTKKALVFLGLPNNHTNRAKLLDALKTEAFALQTIRQTFDSRKFAEDAKKKKEVEAARSVEIEKIQKGFQEKAVMYLLEKNKNLGVHFTLENAIEKANALAYDLAKADHMEKVKAGDTTYSFSGSDSCEDCTGWDGLCHRCNCGNRRVDWTSDGDFINGFYFYGEAY